jgi:hypothetical protein
MRVFGLLILLISFPLWSATHVTKIYDIDYGQKLGDEILVFLTSGHVAKVGYQKTDLVGRLFKAKYEENWFKITLDKNRYITALVPAESPLQKSAENLSSVMLKSNYVPTTVASMADAQKYHREGRRNSKDSQCFNRAMVWSYDWWKNNSVKSMKIFIFFTRTYIRRYNFEWWFHIAPYLHIMEEGKVVERAMDLKYTRNPLPFRRWTDIFMRNDAECKVITRFSDYADYPYTGECYIMRTNMFTYQPADLQMNEAWGYTKTKFNMDEVRAAFLEAYDMHL